MDFGATLVTETDYKSILTMHSQKHFGGVPTYEEVRVDGPPHGRTFTLSVHHVNGERLGQTVAALTRCERTSPLPQTA